MAKYRIVEKKTFEGSTYYTLERRLFRIWWLVDYSSYLETLERELKYRTYKQPPGKVIAEYGT